MRRVITPQPEITLNHTDTFLVTGRDGQVRSGRQGLYHRDVRYLSRYHFTLNGADPVPLTANNVDFHLSRSYFTNPRLGAYRTEVPEGILVLVLDRILDGGGMHEDWEFYNYASTETRFTFRVAFEPSFEDVFEVREAVVRARVVLGAWDARSQTITYRYRKDEYERALRLQARLDPEERMRYTVGALERDMVLAPRTRSHMCMDFRFESGVETHARCMRDGGPRRLPAHGLFEAPSLSTEAGALGRAWLQMQVDLTSLHFLERDGAWLPAAGVPWYAALFGRDPLITAFQCAHVYPTFARASLLALGELQARGVDPWTEAAPGKILHELRAGELAHFRAIPQVPAYTTADASLLYVILLNEAWRWTGDEGLLRACLPVAERCLEWAARHGDLDGDGLQEYARSPGGPGYPHMGWKDSPDAIVHEDGSVATPPIALVELQGYWFDALLRMAELREAVGAGAGALRDEAEALRARVEERFWMEEEGTYAFALDAAKRQVRGVASNAGHLLWSGLPSPERAARVAERLLAADMWSGWGIRTLSTDNPAYNPISYHRGSVWPHDNSLIAWGMRRYGLVRHATRVVEGIVAASARFESASLPELWSGIDREPSDFPVLYLDSNRPQSWAAASVALLVRAVLGLEADPRGRRLLVAPAVPDWVGELRLERIPVLGGRVSLRARGERFWVDFTEGVEVADARS